MESSRSTAGENEDVNGQRNINALIGFCMWTCLGLVAILLSRVPSIEAVQDASHVIWSILHFMWLSFLTFNTFLVMGFIRNREKFHRTHVVFWPSRCRHCAKVLLASRHLESSTDNILKSGNEEIANPGIDNLQSASSSVSIIDNILTNSSNPCMEENCSENQPISDNEHCMIWSFNCNNHGTHSSARFKIHELSRAVVNVFTVFCVICCIGILNDTAITLSCYVQGKVSVVTFVPKIIWLLLYFIFNSVMIVFVECYYDARFVRTFKTLLVASMLTAMCIWLTIIHFSNHFQGFTDQEEESNNSTLKCLLNTTFTGILHQIDTITIPFYFETSIIALGLATHMWKLFVTKPSLQVQYRPFAFRVFNQKAIVQWFHEITSRIRKALRSNCSSFQFGSDINRLRSRQQPISRLLKLVRFSWSLSLLINALFFAASLFLIFGNDEVDANNQDVYLRWCIDIANMLSSAFSVHASPVSQEMRVAGLIRSWILTWRDMKSFFS